MTEINNVLPPPPKKPLPAVPTNETIDMIFEILQSKLPYEIAYKILFTHNGLRHPLVKITKNIISDMQYSLQQNPNKAMSYSCHFKLNNIDIPYRKINERNKISTYYLPFYQLVYLNGRLMKNIGKLGKQYYIQIRPRNEPMWWMDTRKVDIISNHSGCFLWRVIHEQYSITAKELKEQLKMNGIKGYSTLKKKELLKLYLTF